VTVQIKRCNACQQVKLLTDFARHPQNRDGRQGICNPCQAARVPVRRHGMTALEKAQAAEEQGGCAICSTTSPGVKGWVVDHDHRCCGPIRSCTSCRRGVLCGRCNTALGMARDDPAVLRRMADYIESHQTRSRISQPISQLSQLGESL
jgi:hypothetical protein